MNIEDLLCAKPQSSELLQIYEEISYHNNANADKKLILNAAHVVVCKYENEISNPTIDDRDFYNNAYLYLMNSES